jgi:hypothetical protein
MPFGPSRPSVAIRITKNAIKTDSQSSDSFRPVDGFLESGEGDMFNLVKNK